ncbi:MAG: hypothetical protein AB7G25_17380 [Sphingomonadaceae bacterium]
MALAALIFASRTIDDGSDLLRASLPLAGATLLEHQVRRAVRAGANHIVVLVERLPAALIGAVDRLRKGGTRVDIARSVADAADRIHPDETVLVISDGCIAGADVFNRLVASPAPAVMALPDLPGLEDFERIGAQHRWAGLVVIEGDRLQAIAARLGEWDFELTLLRQALADDAAILTAFGPSTDTLPHERPVIARDVADLATLEQRIIDGSAGFRDGWAARYIFPLIERIGFARLARGPTDPWWLGVTAIVLGVIAIPLAAVGWFPLALALLVASGPLASIARRLADVRMTRLRHEHRLYAARLSAASAALIALGIRLGDDGQWGWALLAVLIVGVMFALTREWRTAHRLDNRADMPFMATGDGVIWMFIPFALAGRWGVGMMVAAVYAVTSFVVAQRLVHDAIAAKMRGSSG